MKYTYELTDEQAKAFEEFGILPIKESKLIEEWSPSEKGYVLFGDNDIVGEINPTAKYLLNGSSRKTKKQIETIQKLRYNHDRLHALVCELEPDNIGYIEEFKYYYYIYKVNDSKVWETFCNNTYYPDCIPINNLKTATKICDMLNSGEFKFI